MIVVRSGVAVRIAQQRVARRYSERVDGIAVAESTDEVGHCGGVCKREVHIAHTAHLPLQEYRRLVGLTCTHGCSVERSVAVVGILTIDIPAELRHNHQGLHRCDGRLQRQLVGPLVHKIAQSICRIKRCRCAVYYVLLVVVGEEIACSACA